MQDYIVIGGLFFIVSVSFFLLYLGLTEIKVLKEEKRGIRPDNFLLFSRIDQIFNEVILALRSRNIVDLEKFLTRRFLGTLDLGGIEIRNEIFLTGRQMYWKEDSILEVEFYGKDGSGEVLIDKWLFLKRKGVLLVDSMESLVLK